MLYVECNTAKEQRFHYDNKDTVHDVIPNDYSR